MQKKCASGPTIPFTRTDINYAKMDMMLITLIYDDLIHIPVILKHKVDYNVYSILFDNSHYYS